MSRRTEVESEMAADWLAVRDDLRAEAKPDPRDYEADPTDRRRR